MKTFWFREFARLAIPASFLILAHAGAGQLAAQAPPPKSQDTSVADAARRAREQKNQAPKARREWTNDNLSSSGQPVATAPASEAESAAAAGAAAGEAGIGGGATSAGSKEEQEKERAVTEAELQAEKQKVVTLKRDLDLLERDFKIQRETFFNTTSAATKPESSPALDSLQSQIDAKRQEIEKSQQKISGLEEKLEGMNRELGPKKELPKTAEEQRAAWAARLRPLREELAGVDADIARIRQEAADQGASVAAAAGGTGTITSSRIQRLEVRRAEIQRKIAEIEDEARRQGIPADWVR